MIKTPLVSVLLPSYNHEKYITESILSIINQSYKNIELIVIDDGSNDNSPRIIEELSKKYGFYYLHRENKGLNYTLNELLQIAKGDLIALFSSDDFWGKTKIEEQVHVMNSNCDIELCFTEHFDIDDNSNIIGDGKYNTTKKEKQSFIDAVYNPDFPPASLMYRKQTIDKINFKYINSREIIDDLYSWLYILSHGGYAYVIPKKLTYYRTHATNTHSNHLKIAKGHMKTLELFKDKIPNWKSVETEWSLRNANLLARTDKQESFKYLLKGIHKLHDLRIYKVLLKIFLR